MLVLQFPVLLITHYLDRSSLGINEQPIITIQSPAFEVLPFHLSADDYEIDAHTFSAFGTSADCVLHLRRPRRLVVSRSKNLPKATTLREVDESN